MRTAAIVAASLSLLCLSVPAWGESLLPGPQERAANLEAEQRWLAAADAYAELTRQQPGVPEWQKHIRRCRQQDQITRRHLDPMRSIHLTFEKTVELYTEVLQKIDGHFVSEVDFSRLFMQTLEALDLALANQAFVAHTFAAKPTHESLIRRRASLQKLAVGTQVRDQNELVRRVRAIVVALQQDLGARPAIVMQELVHVACTALDDYGSYLPPDQYALEEALGQAEVAGIGIDLKQEDDRLLITAVLPDSSAARAGLRVGDELLRIDEQRVALWTLEETLLRLMGRLGSSVALEVHSPMEMRPRRVEATRQRLSLPSVTDSRMVDLEVGIGYIHLAYFSSTTIQEFDLAVAKLTMLGMRGLILDLRGNPGGSFHDAVRLADRFISTGVLVSTRGRAMGSTVVYRTEEDMDVTVPLVVLIDGESASASEIVAGAIKDHRRGQVVGERSFGKGTVQYVFPLRATQGGVRLTTAKFFSPLDTCYNEQGVTPDLPVVRKEGATTVESQRRQFEAALRALRETVMKPM